MGLTSGYWKSQALYVAAKLGIADLLRDGPQSPDDLARVTGTHPRGLARLLRALASEGVFAETADGRFAQSPLSEFLRADVPGTIRPMVLMLGEEHYHTWGQLLFSVRTEKPAFDVVHGKPVFDYLAEHPQEAALFDEAMVAIHGAETAAVLGAYDFSGIGTLVDVGGGNGSNLIGILGKYPQLRGVLYDLPHVVARAEPKLKAAGLADRCTAVGGSFFDSVPPGGDAYHLRHIIHDWDDDKSLTILRRCRGAMRPGARLLVVESVIPPGNERFFGKWLDLNMMVIPGGLERTEAQYRELYEKAGFRLTRIVPTRTEMSVIEGEPV
jgi:hypothetical protein